MSCGKPFPEKPVEMPLVPRTSTTAYSQNYTPTITPTETKPQVLPVREEFGHIVLDTRYYRFVISSLLFALSPILTFLGNIFLQFMNPQGSDNLIFTTALLDLVFFGIFIYGIHSISQLEPSSLSSQLKEVPVFFSVYAIVNFLLTVLFESMREITSSITLDELRNIVLQGIGISFVYVIVAVLLLLGALKITNWFEELVILLRAPYNAPTSRLKWYAVSMLIYRGFLLLAFILLLSAIDNVSISTVNNVNLLLSLATITAFVALILQVISGYKMYSVLNNIRQGKYDGSYQQQILTKYQQ
jgi:hypothetical protein